MRSFSRFAAVLAGTLVLSACGGDDSDQDASQGGGTVEVTMVDTAFKPDSLEVEAGETIRFVFRNRGHLPHDAFIGDTAAQADHEREMREAEEGGHGGHDSGDEPGAVTVEPGETGEITHTFDETGTVEIGCHQPGHYALGMKIAVSVV
jgi:uncharacterized cupredoxin-like copper-binding protein